MIWSFLLSNVADTNKSKKVKKRFALIMTLKISFDPALLTRSHDPVHAGTVWGGVFGTKWVRLGRSFLSDFGAAVVCLAAFCSIWREFRFNLLMRRNSDLQITSRGAKVHIRPPTAAVPKNPNLIYTPPPHLQHLSRGRRSLKHRCTCTASHTYTFILIYSYIFYTFTVSYVYIFNLLLF